MRRKNLPEERRRFVRLRSHHLIKYKVLDKGESISFVRDISAGGVLFHSKEYIPPGSMVELTINFPSYPKPIKAVSSVVRVVPMQKVGGFDIGAEFIDLDKEAQTFINEKILKVHKKTGGSRR